MATTFSLLSSSIVPYALSLKSLVPLHFYKLLLSCHMKVDLQVEYVLLLQPNLNVEPKIQKTTTDNCLMHNLAKPSANITFYASYCVFVTDNGIYMIFKVN